MVSQDKQSRPHYQSHKQSWKWVYAYACTNRAKASNFYQLCGSISGQTKIIFFPTFLPSYLKPDRKAAFFLPGFGKEGRKIGKKFRRKVENQNIFVPNLVINNDFLQKTIGKSG